MFFDHQLDGFAPSEYRGAGNDLMDAIIDVNPHVGRDAGQIADADPGRTPCNLDLVGHTLGPRGQNVLHLGPNAGEFGPADLFGPVLGITCDSLSLDPDPGVEL